MFHRLLLCSRLVKEAKVPSRRRPVCFERLEARFCLTWTVSLVAGTSLVFEGTNGHDSVLAIDIPAGKTTIWYEDEEGGQFDTGVPVGPGNPPPKLLFQGIFGDDFVGLSLSFMSPVFSGANLIPKIFFDGHMGDDKFFAPPSGKVVFPTGGDPRAIAS